MAICFQAPVKPICVRPSITFSSTPKPQSLRCNLSVPIRTQVSEPEPVLTSVKTFAPATVANLGPGFDFLGCAVDGLGDFVSLSVDPNVHLGQNARSPSPTSPATLPASSARTPIGTAQASPPSRS